jgi:hypothetical protein
LTASFFGLLAPVRGNPKMPDGSALDPAPKGRPFLPWLLSAVISLFIRGLLGGFELQRQYLNFKLAHYQHRNKRAKKIYFRIAMDKQGDYFVSRG